MAAFVFLPYEATISADAIVRAVFAQADAQYRLTPETLKNYYIRSQGGQMVPLGTVADIKTSQGPSLISLYNLFPSAAINGSAAPGFSSGQGLAVVEGIAKRALAPGVQFEWTAMSYQEKLVGNSAYFIFGLAILLVTADS